MRKTEVFLVFGKHANARTGSPGNQAFFRNAITPILEDIERLGKKGVIIHEGVFRW